MTVTDDNDHDPVFLENMILAKVSLKDELKSLHVQPWCWKYIYPNALQGEVRSKKTFNLILIVFGLSGHS